MSLRTKPPGCADCCLGKKARGFCQSAGSTRATIAFCGEAPGEEELGVGYPFQGMVGRFFLQAVLTPLGFSYSDFMWDNAIRCLHSNKYPIGKERKAAEAMCRQYDRWDEFKPTIDLMTLHPSAVLRQEGTLSMLPLLQADVKKAIRFARSGERVRVLLGDKAAKIFMGIKGGITYWRGHWRRIG